MMWIVLAFGSAIFSGLTAILAKCGIEHVDSNVATALRTFVVLLFSWIMVFVSGVYVPISNIERNTFIFLILSGVSTGVSWLCYFRALQLGDVNKVIPIDKSSTILTILLAVLLLGEKLTLIKAAAILFIGFGTYLMVQKRESKEVKKKNSIWLLYASGSAVFASLTSIFGKIGIEGIDSTLGTAIRTIIVLIMAWIVVFVKGKQSTIRYIDQKSWLFLILSGFATGGSWICYYSALKTGPAGVVVPIDKLSILVTILFSYFVLKEKLSKKSFTGVVLITAGTLSLLL